MNHDGLGRREFLRVTGAGSLGLLAFGWPAWSVAATAEEVLELKLRGAGLTFRGGQPQMVLLNNAEASPLTLIPQAAAVVTKAVRQTPAGPASACTLAWSDWRGFNFSWTVSRLRQLPGVTVQMTFTNASKEPVRLREFQLCQASASVVKMEGKPEDWLVSKLDSYDFPEGGFLTPARSLAQTGEFKFVDALTLYTDHGRKGLLMGAVGPAVSDIFATARKRQWSTKWRRSTSRAGKNRGRA